MRSFLGALVLALPLAVAAPVSAQPAASDDHRHRQSMDMVQTVIDRGSELSLTEGELKQLKAFHSELELKARQRRVSSKPQVTNSFLIVTPEQARTRILAIVGDSRDEAVLRVIGTR
jgi:hypothetical protein